MIVLHFINNQKRTYLIGVFNAFPNVFDIVSLASLSISSCFLFLPVIISVTLPEHELNGEFNLLYIDPMVMNSLSSLLEA